METPRLERSWLDWTADPSGTSAAPHLQAFRVLILLHLCVQAWAWALRPLDHPYTFPPLAIHGCAVALTLAAAVASFGSERWGRMACLASLPIVAFELAWVFPATANHHYLSLLILGLCGLFDLRREGEDQLLLQGLRWVAVIVFFWAGAQKALHGLYFRGEFLSWAVAVGGERWAALFGWLLPGAELTRLQELPQNVGSGPWRAAGLVVPLVSNAVWVGEIVLAVGMLVVRIRVVAVLLALGLVYAIQLAPREFMFALLYTNLLLLFLPGEPNRRLLPVFALAYALLVGAVAGVPGLEGLVKQAGL